MSFVFSRKSREALWGVHSDLVLVVSRGLLYSSTDFVITEGLRSQARQDELYAAGLSMTRYGKHLTGQAIDVMAVGDLDGDGMVSPQDKILTWRPELYAAINEGMQRAAKELEIPIRWGGEFKSFFDGPHFEMA
jgi:peptidoglycan L-alanyl-D-glutamate endopeptidase CwlK